MRKYAENMLDNYKVVDAYIKEAGFKEVAQKGKDLVGKAGKALTRAKGKPKPPAFKEPANVIGIMGPPPKWKRKAWKKYREDLKKFKEAVKD